MLEETFEDKASLSDINANPGLCWRNRILHSHAWSMFTVHLVSSVYIFGLHFIAGNRTPLRGRYGHLIYGRSISSDIKCYGSFSFLLSVS